MKLDNFLISFVVFSFFVAASTFIFVDINNNYGTDLDSGEFNNTYNQIDDMYEISDEMKTDVFEGDIEAGEATFDSTIRNIYKALRYVKDTFGLFGTILNDVARLLGLPGFVVKFGITLMAFSVLIAFMLLIMRVRA